MSKVIKGTKGLRQAQQRSVNVHKATGGNISKIRCTFCGTLAHPRPNAQGGTTLTCGSCGRKFSVTTL